jgi:hypothetical protein
MSYEIAIFEYSDLYSGDADVSPDKVICEFIEYYMRYFDPRYYEKEYVMFQKGRTWLSYTDKSGGDKPITIMLIGSITDNLVMDLEEAVAKVYMRSCEDCGKEVKNKKWAICEVCMEKYKTET